MGRSAIFAASAAVLLCAANAALAGGMLINGDLELGADGNSADGWILNETPGGANSADFTGFANHTPAGARGLWFRPFDGGIGGPPVNAILYQDVPAVPGVDYVLSAWFKEEAGYSGQNLLFMHFFDAGDGLIGSVSFDVDAAQTNDSVWRQFSVGSVAPAGTAVIRVGANMQDGVFSDMNPQSSFVDDFQLLAIPAPAGVVDAGMGLTGLAARRRR